VDDHTTRFLDGLFKRILPVFEKGESFEDGPSPTEVKARDKAMDLYRSKGFGTWINAAQTVKPGHNADFDVALVTFTLWEAHKTFPNIPLCGDGD
jgi:hypothetical protein